MKRLHWTFGAALLAATAFAAPAFAGSITQNVTIGGGTASVTTDLNALAFNNSISLFNSAAVAAANPGFTVTLNDVKLTVTTALQTGGTVTNNASQAQTFKFALNVESWLSSGTVTGSASSAQSLVLSNFGFGSSGDVTQTFPTVTYTNLASNTTAAYPTSGSATLSTSPTVTLTDGTSLAAFSGIGTFLMDMSTLSSQTIAGGGGNISASLSTLAGATLSVEYDYTLTQIPTPGVPEPASLALLGAGLVGMGVIGRRGKKA